MSRSLRFHPLDLAAAVAFLAYSSSAVVTPIVLVQLGRELGFGLVGGGGLELARGALILVTLLAGGFISAHMGKARALGGSLLLLALGLFLYSRAPGYGAVVLALCLAGVGGGVVEALLNPLVEELHREDSGRYLNIINGFWSLGVLMTTLTGGELLTRTGAWRPFLQAVSLLSLVAGILFLVLRRVGPPRVRVSLRAVLGHKVDILRSRGFWLFTALMFLGGAAEGSFTFWSASYLQLVHGLSPRAGGMGTAIFALGMMLIRFGGGWMVPQRHLRSMIIGSAFLGVGVSALFPYVPPGLPLYGALFLAGGSIACFWPSLQSLAVERLDLDPTALFILLSCGGIGGFSFASWFIGWLGETHGLDRAFGVVPVLFLVLAGLVWAEGRSPKSPPAS